MRCTMLKEPYAWAPICFEIQDILLLLEETVMAELVIRLGGRFYWIGVACEYDRVRQLFGDQIYYIDDQEFASLEALVTHAVLDGRPFSDISAPLQVIDTLEGDPAFYRDLVAELKKDLKKDMS